MEQCTLTLGDQEIRGSVNATVFHWDQKASGSGPSGSKKYDKICTQYFPMALDESNSKPIITLLTDLKDNFGGFGQLFFVPVNLSFNLQAQSSH